MGSFPIAHQAEGLDPRWLWIRDLMALLVDAVAASGLNTSGNIGFKRFSFRHITRVLQDGSFGILHILPLSRHAVVPSAYRLQVGRVTQGYSFRTPPNSIWDQALDSLAHPAV
jgi:hypothetical protein